MEEFSYNVEFYKNHIFTIEELMNRRDEQDNAKYIEDYYSSFNNNVDIIRDCILNSYRLNKYLTKEERLHYVRGIMYSNQYLNIEDFDNFVEIICSDKKESLEQSVFRVRHSSNDYDEDFFANYARMLTCNFENLGVEEDLESKEDDDISIDMKEDGNEEEEDITESYKSRLTALSAIERIDYLDANFDHYMEGILKFKKINKRKDKFAYNLILQGAEDYFTYVRDLFYETYEFIVEEKKRKSKNFLLSI